MNVFLSRILRAIKLETQLYEEIEADRNALPQALGIVILSSLAAGIGGIGKAGIAPFFGGLISALIGWFIWHTLV